MLPDEDRNDLTFLGAYASQCTYRCVVLPDLQSRILDRIPPVSQCTYRCVVLPDSMIAITALLLENVSMHLQVRGAP